MQEAVYTTKCERVYIQCVNACVFKRVKLFVNHLQDTSSRYKNAWVILYVEVI